MPDADRQAAIEILQKYDRQFTEIIDLTGGKPKLTKPEKDRARELLRKLKDELKSDCKELYRRDQRDELNRIERTSLEPALRKAGANIATRVNSTPGREWSSDLYGARIDITWMLYNLQHPKA
jgi:hypothetical protein